MNWDARSRAVGPTALRKPKPTNPIGSDQPAYGNDVPMGNPANCSEDTSCPAGGGGGGGVSQEDLDNPHTRSTLQPHRGLPTFPQALRLITRSRENNPGNRQAIRQTRLSLLRQWHGWTIGEYLETHSSCDREHRPARSELPVIAWARTRGRGWDATDSEPRRPIPPRPPIECREWRSLSHLRPELLAELHRTRNRRLDVSSLRRWITPKGVVALSEMPPRVASSRRKQTSSRQRLSRVRSQAPRGETTPR